MNYQDYALTTSEYALLGFLLAGPCHGYELHKKISQPNGAGMVWEVKIANMYAQLEKLERRGLISGRLQEKEQRPTRTQFSLTEEGKKEFNRWLREPVRHPRDFRHEFLMRLYFITRYQPSELEALVEQQIQTCRSWQREFESTQDAIPLADNFANLTSYFRYSQIQSLVDWLTWVKTQIPTILTQRGKK